MAQQLRLASRSPLFTPRDPGRRLGGLVLAVLGPLAFTPFANSTIVRPFPALLYIFCVVAVSLIGRLLAGIVSTAVSALLLDYFVLTPTHSFGIGHLRELFGLAIFVIVALVTSTFLSGVELARSEAEGARKRLGFLGRASDILAGSLDYDRTLVQLVHLVVPELADWATVDFLEADGSIANRAFQHRDEGRRWRLGTATRARPQPRHPEVRRGVRPVIRSGQGELYAEVPEGLLVEPTPDGADHGGLVSLIVAPLTARGRTFGALTLVVSRSHRRYGTDDLLLAEEVADRAALAIDNASLHGSEGQARQAAELAATRTAVLQHVTALLSGSLTPEDIADVLVRDGIRAIGAIGGLVATLREDSRALEVMRSFGYESTQMRRWSRFDVDADLPLSQAVRTREPVVIEGVGERNEMFPLLSGTPPLSDHSLVCLPMVAGDRPLGAMAVTFAEARTFSTEELDVMMALATQGAQALDRARLFADRDRVARALQRGLLPPELPDIPGVGMATSYRPSGTTEVGGDFYDAFQTGAGEWAILIGDVVGKGPEAAATTGFIRNTVRAIAGFEQRPSVVLSKVSELLRSSWEGLGFSTICYVRVRVTSKGVRLTLCSAGHPLPFLIRPNEPVASIGRFGQVLGVFEGPIMFNVAADLRPGDVVLLYTDGLVDPRVWGGDPAEGLLPATLEGYRGAKAKEVIEALTDLLDQAELRDDVALLAFRIE